MITNRATVSASHPLLLVGKELNEAPNLSGPTISVVIPRVGLKEGTGPTSNDCRALAHSTCSGPLALCWAPGGVQSDFGTFPGGLITNNRDLVNTQFKHPPPPHFHSGVMNVKVACLTVQTPLACQGGGNGGIGLEDCKEKKRHDGYLRGAKM